MQELNVHPTTPPPPALTRCPGHGWQPRPLTAPGCNSAAPPRLARFARVASRGTERPLQRALSSPFPQSWLSGKRPLVAIARLLPYGDRRPHSDKVSSNRISPNLIRNGWFRGIGTANGPGEVGPYLTFDRCCQHPSDLRTKR